MPETCGFPQCPASLDPRHASSHALRRTGLLTIVLTPGFCPTGCLQLTSLTDFTCERHGKAFTWIPTISLVISVFSASPQRGECVCVLQLEFLLMSVKVWYEVKGKKCNLRTCHCSLRHTCLTELIFAYSGNKTKVDYRRVKHWARAFLKESTL